MSSPTFYTVPPERAGTKLDRLIQDFARVSRREARLLIAMGRVRVNRRATRILARPIKAGAQVEIMPEQAGQSLALSGAHAPQEAPRPRFAGPRILYLDRYVVVLDKPAGLLSETDRFNSPSLQTLVPKLLSARGEHDKLWLVHRLDAGTSGVIIMARTPGAAAHLSASFRQAQAHKTYVALCAGVLAQTHDVDAPIGRTGGTRHAVMASGKSAQTRIEPWAQMPSVTLVCCRPKTGRTHQIRVHTAHLGHPIVGDRLYGGPGYAPAEGGYARMPRAMLHALRLEIDHPKQVRRLLFEAGVPADFAAAAQSFGLDLAGLVRQG